VPVTVPAPQPTGPAPQPTVAWSLARPAPDVPNVAAGRVNSVGRARHPRSGGRLSVESGPVGPARAARRA